MTQLATLQLLIGQAEQERDQALAACGEAQTRLARARAQADDLAHYQSDYHQRWQNEARAGLGVETLRCYQSYAARLSDAIGQQDQLLGHLDQRLQIARQELQEREMRLASLRKLLERRQAELLQHQSRQEQKQNDEWAARRTRSPSTP